MNLLCFFKESKVDFLLPNKNYSFSPFGISVHNFAFLLIVEDFVEFTHHLLLVLSEKR